MSMAAELLNRNAAGSGTGPDELILIRKDGRRIVAEIRAFPVTVGGQSLVLGIARDVTERKLVEEAHRESEEQYKDLVERAGIAIAIDDRAGNMVYWNERYAEIFGYAPEEMTDFSHRDMVHPEDLELAQVMHRRRLAGEPVPKRYEFRGLCKDGSTVHIEVCATVVHEDGEPVGTRCYMWDITDRKRAEAELRRARAEAESASRARNAFLTNMSHELRTPMNGVLGMLDLALRTELTAKQKSYLQRARASAASLMVLLGDILDLARIEAGKLEMQSVPFRLQDCLDIVIGIAGPQAEHKGLELTTTLDPGIPEFLSGDAARLRQILMHLLANAIKFTASGSVSLHVTMASSASESRPVLRFSVTDTGVGIPDAKIKTIFGAFTQVDDSSTREHGGTGVGLALVHRLVRMMGGKISVDSEVGRGTTVTFTARMAFAALGGQKRSAMGPAEPPRG
jgi:PAS domain S-box-containing protein